MRREPADPEAGPESAQYRLPPSGEDRGSSLFCESEHRNRPAGKEGTETPLLTASSRSGGEGRGSEFNLSRAVTLASLPRAPTLSLSRGVRVTAAAVGVLRVPAACEHLSWAAGLNLTATS